MKKLGIVLSALLVLGAAIGGCVVKTIADTVPPTPDTIQLADTVPPTPDIVILSA